MTTTVNPASIAARADDLHVEVHGGSEVCVVQLEGSLRAVTAHKVQAATHRLDASTGSSVILDASLLWEIDDIGVHILGGLQRQVEARGGKLIVYAASGQVARALDRSSVHQ